jgi:hypothetical protein
MIHTSHQTGTKPLEFSALGTNVRAGDADDTIELTLLNLPRIVIRFTMLAKGLATMRGTVRKMLDVHDSPVDCYHEGRLEVDTWPDLTDFELRIYISRGVYSARENADADTLGLIVCETLWAGDDRLFDQRCTTCGEAL